jgi:phosphoglycolate phosphatase
MAPRALIVDLDGTIWDSYRWYSRVLGRASRRAEEAALASLRDGVPAARLLRDASITPSRFRAICDEATDFEPYPGVRETLERVREQEIPLGAATNLPRWIAEPMLECLRLRSAFVSLVDWGRTRRHKPHPEPILEALADLCVEPSADTWYIGDSASDGVAAARAGISFAWAEYGYGIEPPSEAAAIVSQFADVLEL